LYLLSVCANPQVDHLFKAQVFHDRKQRAARARMSRV
jgi:hypothetical protein